MPLALLIGIGAGVVSAVLFASAATGTLLGLLVLFFLSPLPVAIAGLGWGWQSAAAAAAASAAVIMFALSGRAALFHLLALGLPTVVLSYLCLLNREIAPAGNGAEAKLEWYPIGRIVMVAAVWAGALAALALLTTASDIEGLRAALKQTFERIFVLSPPGSPTGAETLGEREISAFTELMVLTFAAAVATMWMTLATLNLWLAGLVTWQSGRLARPWPELAALRLPRTAPLAFAVAIVLTFLPGYGGLIASGFASAFLFAYTLLGLAIIHYVTRPLSARGLVLGAVYGALVILYPFSWLLLAALGLAEPISPLRRRLPPPGSEPST